MEIRIVIDDRIVSAVRRSRRPLAWMLGAFAFGGGALALAAPVEDLVTFEAGDIISAADMNANFAALRDAWNDHVIRQDMTISIANADGCGALVQALADLSEQVIRQEATVTIELAPGSYTCADTIYLQHPQGGHIQIVGEARATVVLNFPADTVGFANSHGHSVGRLASMTLTGATGGAGVNARGPRFQVEDLLIQGFDFGVQAEQGGVLIGTGLELTGNTEGARVATGSYMTLTDTIAAENVRGFVIQTGASASLGDCDAIDNEGSGFSTGGEAVIINSEAAGNQIGFEAGARGAISGSNLTATGNYHGFFAVYGGLISVNSPTANGQEGYGFLAEDFGYLDLAQATAMGNLYGFVANTGGKIRTAGTETLGGNTTADYSPAPVSVNTAASGIYD